MAGFAIFSPVLSVDMNIMQVIVAVPEAGGKGRLGISQEVPIMTAKTEGIFIIIIHEVEVG
jgi:hypothetical protein